MSNNKLVGVTFEPDGIEVRVPTGTLLSRAAAAGGMPIEMPCGGMGVCGKCRVMVSGGVEEPSETERFRLGEELLSQGVRLACQTKVTGVARITIPESSRSLVQKILSHSIMRECAVASGISKFYCELTPPSLEDERAEFERLADYLSDQDVHIRPRLRSVHDLSRILKSADYKVTAVVCEDELLAVEPGDTTGECYGIAYDLGSTTVVGYLLDLLTGEQLAVAAEMNPQMVYGDDLISRISFATTQADGASILQKAAVDALNRIAKTAAENAGITTDRIYKIVVVGNTCMTHLFQGISVTSLGQSPYVPSVCSDLATPAAEIGLEIAPNGRVVVLPNVAGFVGSDLVAVLLASDWENSDKTRLAVDIGTNGEMALKHQGRTYACSAAAGPAFEGAGISCGVRGGPGAIDSVMIDDDVHITTIGNQPPVGICGSGLVDAVAQMLNAGVVDESGRMVSPSETASLPKAVAQRVIETPEGVEFVLATAEESGVGRTLTLTYRDIRRLQLAKGSIHAAIQTLIRSAGTDDSQLQELLLAGAFGNYIRVESAIRIGLIPNVPREIVISIGNAAGAGSRLAVLCAQEMDVARRLAASANYLELAVSPDYQMELMERMMFPSTMVL